MKIDLFVLIIPFFTFFSLSSQASEPLLYQGWKNQQILEAQNQMLRISARINSLKIGKSGATTAAAHLPTNKIKSSDPLAAAEKDLRRSQESLVAAQNLSFDDYVTIYIPTLQDQPEMVAHLAEKLSHEELVDVVKLLIRQTPRIDAKRNAALLGSLSSTPGSRTN